MRLPGLRFDILFVSRLSRYMGRTAPRGLALEIQGHLFVLLLLVSTTESETPQSIYALFGKHLGDSRTVAAAWLGGTGCRVLSEDLRPLRPWAPIF